MTVCYLGPLKDYSGYGEANRHDVAALHAAGVDVFTSIVTYVNDPADFGDLGVLVQSLSEVKKDYRIKILHTTPDQFPRFHEPGKYHIGRVFWETDRLPDGFAEGLRVVDEIWTGSQANEAAIRAAGINKPVHIIPQAIELERPEVEPYKIAEAKKGCFYFYSIFEWTPRKNAKALFQAFYEEFRKNENVALLVKTYHRDFSARNKNLITVQAQKFKHDFKGNKPVYLYKELMDRSQIWRFHQTGDVFVSANRGEGWGLPQVEAMLASKPVISTYYGGVMEYLPDTHAVRLPFKMIPVRGMMSDWYAPDQNWADINVADLRRAMRQAYTRKKATAEMGARAHDFAVDTFAPVTVGGIMHKRLEEIEATL